MPIHRNKHYNNNESLEWELGRLLKFEYFGDLLLEYIKQDKLEIREVKHVFIGYHEGMKGYKIWKIDPKRSYIYHKLRSYCLWNSYGDEMQRSRG